MADVLFRYLLMARDRDQSWYRRAFLSDERALAAGVERIEQTAAVRIGLAVQLERVTETNGSAPASTARTITFHDDATRNPPKAPALETRTDRFPLRRSQLIVDCFGCKASGLINCSNCLGTGQARCPTCLGTGRGSSLTSAPCSGCGGVQIMRCYVCAGRRIVKHTTCAGEGRLVTWQEELHSYWVEWIHELHLPPDAPDLAMDAAVARWLTTHNETVADLRLVSSVAHLAYETPETATAIAAAEMRRGLLERRAHAGGRKCLFTVSTFQVIPVAACVVRSEEAAHAQRYWLVGRADEAIEILPKPTVDPWKLAGWPGLLVGITNGLATIAHGAVASLVAPALAAGGLAIAAVGLKRVAFNRREPVRTVAILPAIDEASPYLACLATIGAFTRQLEIFDSRYRAHLEALMGRNAADTQSHSLVVGLPGNRRIRLTQIARPLSLTRGEMARMVEVIDGLLYLESPSHTAGVLRSRVHGATTARPPEARLLLTAGAEAGDGLSLDRIRSAFLRETEADIDWQRVFQQLWAPIASVLAGQKRAAIWPASRETSPAR